jgi:hypothetical protein
MSRSYWNPKSERETFRQNLCRRCGNPVTHCYCYGDCIPGRTIILPDGTEIEE